MAAATADAAPEVQQPDPLVLPGPDERWVVLHTHSRREKQVARACTYLNITYYLPLRDHWTGNKRRRRYLLPLFPGYVFACLAPWSRVDLLRTGVIAKTIRVDHPEVLLDELRQIRAALEKGAEVTLLPRIARGERVRVVRGNLAGVEGLVTAGWRRGKRLRLTLNVSVLSKAASLIVYAADVERVRTRVDSDDGAN